MRYKTDIRFGLEDFIGKLMDNQPQKSNFESCKLTVLFIQLPLVVF